MISNNIFRHFHQGALPSLKALGQKEKKKFVKHSRLSTLAALELLGCVGFGTLSWHTPGRKPAFTQREECVWGKGPAEAALLCLKGKLC